MRNLKKKGIYIIAILLGMLGGIVASISITATASPSLTGSIPPPTPPPTPTPGPPPPIITPEPLDNPISSEAEALEWAIYYDTAWSTHTEAWDADTLHREPGRIQVQAFDSVMEESADAGHPVIIPPESPAERGPVWRITIQGEVQVSMFGMGVPKNARYDGVTYAISATTGNLVAIRPGKMISFDER